MPADGCNLDDRPLYQINGFDIDVTLSSHSEAKLAIKQLRLEKRRLGLEKKQADTAMKAIRAEAGTPTPMVRGGGALGNTARAFQRLSRENARQRLPEALAPYQSRKAEVERLIVNIDTMILSLEQIVANPDAFRSARSDGGD